MSARRIVGTETEFGIYRPGDRWANAVALATEAVRAYAQVSREGDPVRWDYAGEDPLRDLRGHRLERAAARPSQLTDDPYHLAPPGGEEDLPRPTAQELRMPAPQAVVLRNGARLYVDHAHPEYSAPEALTPQDAVVWDRAGEVIARRIMERTRELGRPLVLVKNNTDGKGASYGAHENYRMRRDVELGVLVAALIPFLVTRPAICGAGRVGLGQRSQRPGFQISQRADFIENDVGLETTFDRPIVNTRDEPHADPARFRRLHVIVGDANQFDVSTLLRIGTTSLVLWALEQGAAPPWGPHALGDPVEESWAVSHDPTLRHRLRFADGSERTALDVQRAYLEWVRAAEQRAGAEPDPATRDVLGRWAAVLELLRRDPAEAAPDVEWVGKLQLLDRARQRWGTDWADVRLRAMDLRWAELDPERSLVARLDAAGRVRRLADAGAVERAADEPPDDTRAHARGRAVATRPDLVRASWTSLVFDPPGADHLVRRPIPDAG